MGMQRGRAGSPRSARCGQTPTPAEEGVTLVEIMIALAVLLVTFLSTSQLVFASLGTATSNSDKEIAESVATSVLSQERQAAFNEGDEWFSDSGLPSASGSGESQPGAAWCNTTCSPIVQVIASTSYYVYVSGGWCEETALGTWGNTANDSFGNTSPYPGYFLAVKVAWGAGSEQTTNSGVAGINVDDEVVMQGLVTTSGGDASSAPTTGPIYSCPVGVLG
jgi:type II secretory pathway pseudopilin PulG